MTTLIAILINFLMAGLGMQEMPDSPPEDQSQISVEIPDKITEKTDQNC